MSGILGIWNLDGRPLDRTTLSDLGATIAHRGPDAYDFWVDGPVGLACHLLRVTPESAVETQPVVGVSRVVAVFDGRLDNREELLVSLPLSPCLNAGSPDPDIVLAAYEQFGEQFAERLNGDFALGVFDPGRRKLVLARDAIGVRPLYYCWTANRNSFLFASEIKALLAHPEVSTQPDPDALADLLLGSRALVARGITCFRGIHSVPPSHMATLSGGEFKTWRYWDFDPTSRIRLSCFGEYAEAFRDRFATAVKRRVRSAHPVAVAVSGGLDSSAVFCMAQRLGQRAAQAHAPVIGLSHTYPAGSRCDEQEYLADIEREYDCEIRRIPADSPGFVEGCEAEIRHVEAPRLDLVWNNTQALNAVARRLGARVLLTGHWGDEFLFDQHYLIDLLRAGRWRTLWRELNHFPDWFPGLLDPGFFRRTFVRNFIRFQLPDRLMPLYRKIHSKLIGRRKGRSYFTHTFQQRRVPPLSFHKERRFASAHALSLYETARSGYYLACMEWHSTVSSLFGTEIAFPFYDRELISFLMAIPGDMQMWNGVPKSILREGLRGVLPPAIANRRGKADFTARVNEGVDCQLPQLFGWLVGDPFIVNLGYIEKNSVGAILAELRTGRLRQDAILSWALRDVLALELWLQIFFGALRERDIRNSFFLNNTKKQAGVTA